MEAIYPSITRFTRRFLAAFFTASWFFRVQGLRLLLDLFFTCSCNSLTRSSLGRHRRRRFDSPPLLFHVESLVRACALSRTLRGGVRVRAASLTSCALKYPIKRPNWRILNSLGAGRLSRPPKQSPIITSIAMGPQLTRSICVGLFTLIAQVTFFFRPIHNTKTRCSSSHLPLNMPRPELS